MEMKKGPKLRDTRGINRQEAEREEKQEKKGI